MEIFVAYHTQKIHISQVRLTLYRYMTERTFQLCLHAYQYEAFSGAHCGLPGVCDNCVYHHQTQPASGTCEN